MSLFKKRSNELRLVCFHCRRKTSDYSWGSDNGYGYSWIGFTCATCGAKNEGEWNGNPLSGYTVKLRGGTWSSKNDPRHQALTEIDLKRGAKEFFGKESA